MATRTSEWGGGDEHQQQSELDLANGVKYEDFKTKEAFTQALTNGYIKNGKITCPKKNGLNGHIPMNSTNTEPETSKPKNRTAKESFEIPSIVTIFLTHLGFYILMFLGYLSQTLFPPKVAKETNREGYPPLYNKFVTFYSLYLYRRIKDCWNYPICSVPGAELVLKNRVSEDYGWTFKFTGEKTKCLNLGSYNYLGFAESEGPCADAAVESIEKYGVSTCSSRQKYGTCDLHVELEQLTAEFLGTEDAITFGMGFATNALNIPVILSPGCLVISDEKNHASLILGIRMSGATVKVFHHNDVDHLEKRLQEAIVYGQPKCKTHTPWKKILIVVEGVYSMEGTVVRLPEIIELKKKYKAYLYLDEAHSVGAMGKCGRGVVDYYGCNPKDIDILMGTFTKSFGSAGGYIAGSRSLISHIRKHSCASKYATAMSPPVAAQIITVFKILMGKDGTDEGKKRIERLARNTKYFRRRLAQIGVITYGNEDSPVVPILVYLFSKISSMVRTLIKHKVATVGVGYPATPLMQGRIRICLSAAHTKEQLDYALETIDKVADELGLKYSRKPRDPNPIDYDALELYD
ncbi:PREDICTED: serine palmitoyltransferase 2-like [Nicrophorus vespilloides]|uniref:serine C-palmitoyltransferase n=1 Tax=Nicrophorus vespilloides TaxID=110193 RepID=A0ABM1MCA4_NICVS|nr:PREDICTED: serine palmitoyltransferase 2-like [Nicrophorus vespilloides]